VEEAIFNNYHNLISKSFYEISEISPKLVDISSNRTYKDSLELISENGKLNNHKVGHLHITRRQQLKY